MHHECECGINRIHHWCSVGTEKSQPEGTPFQWETRLAIFNVLDCESRDSVLVEIRS